MNSGLLHLSLFYHTTALLRHPILVCTNPSTDTNREPKSFIIYLVPLQCQVAEGTRGVLHLNQPKSATVSLPQEALASLAFQYLDSSCQRQSGECQAWRWPGESKDSFSVGKLVVWVWQLLCSCQEEAMSLSPRKNTGWCKQGGQLQSQESPLKRKCEQGRVSVSPLLDEGVDEMDS